ncbi:MAG: FHA domain-containing protein [Chloroflexota bacterium]|nr:FHA domain-containing protein [Chloroflexota bacterium]
MTYLDDTFKQYIELRAGGRDAKSTLETIRLRIELLDTVDRNEMVRLVRDWESERKGTVPADAMTSPTIQAPIQGGQRAAPTEKSAEKSDGISQRLAQASVVPQATAPAQASPAFTSPPSTAMTPTPTPMTAEMIRCPNCRKPNKATDVFCFACGEFLRKDKAASAFETQRFDDTGALPSADFFDEDTTLILTVASTKDSPRFTVRPQDYRHEVVIGRSDGGTMTPDIDLAAHNAGDLGVSRLHVGLQHNSRNNILSISDMKSANGTYVNGQKLYPQEVRVLRHGDELRLGRMVLRVFFEHSSDRKR